MKFQPDQQGQVFIHGHDHDFIAVSGQKYTTSIIIDSTKGVEAWNCSSMAELTEADFQKMADLSPELVLFGSGSRLKFPSPALLRPLMAKGIGIETMDTAAACRTFNVLSGEGRRVVAAMWLSSINP
jgi:uncharacterized protein